MPAVGAEPADTVGKPLLLDDIIVVSTGPRRILKTDRDGAIRIDGQMLAEAPAALAVPDPVALINSLPAVATPNELQATISVRGGNPGDNRFSADGARVVNPMHLLGIFSTYNPSFYKDYTFRAGRIPATVPSKTGGEFAAYSAQEPDSVLSGAVTIGLIESHFALNIPVGSKVSVMAGARRTYLNEIFPDILTLGNSKLKYSFTDFNLSAVARVKGDIVKISFLGNRDDMSATIRANGSKDGSFGWKNVAASSSWFHRNMETTLSYSHFDNSFYLTEGSRTLNLPSSLSEVTAAWLWNINRHWKVESDLSIRTTSGQYNRDLGPAPSGRSRTATEWNVGADYLLRHGRLNLDAGARLSSYFSRGYNRVVPQPRLSLTWEASDAANPFVSYSRTAQFERLIQESTGGLPADFISNCSRELPARVIDNFEIGAAGVIPGVYIAYTLEGYYRRSNHAGEFLGSLLDLTNGDYNPISDFADGKGYSLGLSAMLMRQFGKVRGRVSYNLGKSRVRIPRIGTDWMPSNSDRLHDLSATLTWEPLRHLTLSATFTHATGLPFTRAKFGYILGENLICEYFPHNSSRLPAYNRLDIGAGYRFKGRHGLGHAFQLSIYNTLANRNVLFQYTSYTVSEGIVLKESVMKTVIPSISYTLSF